MDKFLNNKEIDAIIAMTKPSITPKQKLIEAVIKELQTSVDYEKRNELECDDHYETGYQTACARCITLIAEILP